MLKKLFLLSTVASLAAFPALAQEATQPDPANPPAEQIAPQPADQAPEADMTQQQPPAGDPNAADPNAPATDMTQQPTAARADCSGRCRSGAAGFSTAERGDHPRAGRR